MNFPEDKDLDAIMKGGMEIIDRMKWKPVYPNVSTYKSKKSGKEKVLDYIWVGKTKGQAISLDAPKAAFSDIDHAPIFFEVGY